MAKMAGLHAEGVTDMHSYDVGVQDGYEVGLNEGIVKEKVTTINSLITAITMAELTAPEIADALVEQLIKVDRLHPPKPDLLP